MKSRPVEQRLEERLTTDLTTGCELWQGAKNNIGFGMIRHGEKMRTVHKLSYELHHGTVPAGVVVRHTCFNYHCCNPKHLTTGTRQDVTDYMYKSSRDNAFKTLVPTKCEHCGKVTPFNLHSRWHGTRCKFNPNKK